MFSKILATTALASLADAQTASVSSYSVTPPTLKNDEKDLVASQLSIEYEQLISGADSNTIQSQTFSMSLAEGVEWVAGT